MPRSDAMYTTPHEHVMRVSQVYDMTGAWLCLGPPDASPASHGLFGLVSHSQEPGQTAAIEYREAGQAMPTFSLVHADGQVFAQVVLPGDGPPDSRVYRFALAALIAVLCQLKDAGGLREDKPAEEPISRDFTITS